MTELTTDQKIEIAKVAATLIGTGLSMNGKPLMFLDAYDTVCEVVASYVIGYRPEETK